MSSLAITVSERESLVRSYFAYCRHLLLDPRDFFRREFANWTLTEALAFGLVSAWLSTLCVFIMQSITGMAAQELFANWFEHLLLGEAAEVEAEATVRRFLSQAGWVVASPFVHLWYMASIAWLLYMFARLMIPESGKGAFRTMLKILGIAATGLWFSVIPIFGGIIAYVITLALAVVGVSEVYAVSTRRSLMVVVFPQMLLALIFLILISVLFLLIAVSLGAVMAQLMEQQMSMPLPLPF